MKISLTLFLLFFWANGYVLGQSTCKQGNKSTCLKSGNLEATFSTQGNYFIDSTFSKSGLYWKNSFGQRLPISFLNSIWFRGKVVGSDTNILLRIRYNGSTNIIHQPGYDLWPGPVNEGEIYGTNPGICNFWDRHFQVGRESIDSLLHLLDSLDVPLPGSLIPREVRNWPGRGNAFLKAEALQSGSVSTQTMDQDLAPFVDQNQNGIYEPEWGDLPDLQQKERMVWWVLNDVGNKKLYSNYKSMPAGGLEVQFLAYMYPAIPENPFLANTLFLDWKLKNEGVFDLESCYIGVYQDQDIGSYKEDLFRCHPLINLQIAYNKTNTDLSFQQMGISEMPPALGTKILKAPGPLANTDGFDNNRNGQIDEEGETRLVHRMGVFNWGLTNWEFAENNHDEWNEWGLIGISPSFGVDRFYGTCSNSATSNQPIRPSRFHFPGSYDPLGYGIGGTVAAPIILPPWSEEDCPENLNMDKTTILSSGPFALPRGTSIDYQYCLLVGHGKESAMANMLDVEFISDSLEQILPQLQAQRPAVNPLGDELKVQVYPNPLEGGELKLYCKEGIDEVRLLDAQGSRMLLQVQPGLKTVRLAFPGHKPGLYLAQIRSGERWVVKKVLVSTE